MDLKKNRELLMTAGENALNELLKVLNKKMDPQEIDPEKVKISASAYRLAMEDAISIMDSIEHMQGLNIDPTEKKEQESFFGVETRVKK